MRTLVLFTGICVIVAANATLAQTIDEPSAVLRELDWKAGPGTYRITQRAEIALPEGFDYLGPDDTARLMALMENPSNGKEYYVGPVDMRWFAIFSYDDTGHITDDDDIDAEEILAAVRRGTDIANRERRRNGWAEVRIIGWQYPPFYEQTTNRLSWAILAESSGERVVNYNTRLLGRTGVMSAVLVASPESLDSAVKEFHTLLTRFRFTPGNRYAEYRPGDKLASYGLAALIAGGATAAVAKSGLGKGLVKLLLAAGAAVIAFFGSVIKRLMGRK